MNASTHTHTLRRTYSLGSTCTRIHIRYAPWFLFVLLATKVSPVSKASYLRAVGAPASPPVRENVGAVDERARITAQESGDVGHFPRRALGAAGDIPEKRNMREIPQVYRCVSTRVTA